MDIKQEPFDLHESVFKTEPYLISVDEIKEEIVESEGLKTEQLSHLMPKFDHDSELENVHFFPKFPSIKTELENTSEVKADIYIKQENSESDFENDLLTTNFDLPTLKNENTDYLNYLIQPCSSKNEGRILNPLKNTSNIVSETKKRRYLCPVCLKYLPSSNSRLKHFDGHFRKRPLVCKFCGKLMTKMEFFRHYFIHLVKSNTRNVSPKINTVPKIETIWMINNPEPKSKSLIYNLGSKGLHEKCFENTNEKLYKCDICSKAFIQKCNLQQHLIIHTNEKPFKCDFCYKEFNRMSNLHRHLISHPNKVPFKCNICSKEFYMRSNLQKHLLIHTKERPFQCDICPKKFVFKSKLLTHLLSHTNETPIKCDVCFKGFKLKCKLRKHLIIHTNEKPFQCDICSKKFNRHSSLQRHSLIHTNDKPFKCDVCSKEFCVRYNLQRHSIIHTNEKPFECEICCSKFNLKSNFQKHLVIHTNEKPFKCDNCSKRFNHKSNLHQHKITCAPQNCS